MELDKSDNKMTAEVFEYSTNPFTPKGKMNRAYYAIYIFTLSFASKTIEISLTETGLFKIIYYAIAALIIAIIFLVFQLFITKKRILDITNDSKKSWNYASLFVVSAVILTVFHLNLILLPFGLYILFKGPYKEKEYVLKSPNAPEFHEIPETPVPTVPEALDNE